MTLHLSDSKVSSRDIYFFDLQGYLIIREALSSIEVEELNSCLNQIPPLKTGETYQNVHAHDYNDGGQSGLNLQQIYEAGQPFENLIDHSSWFEHMKLFVGGEGTFDYHHGPLFIDENFVNFREPGEAIGMHSGGYPPILRNQYRYHGDRFMCGQVNALIALTNIGHGDGGTTLIPGSHKSNFEHPDIHQVKMRSEGFGEMIEGAIEVHLNAGDAIVFVDSICHGSAKRINKGVRKIIVYRYGPSWGNFRHGYRPSEKLIQRLTPQRRSLVYPHTMWDERFQKISWNSSSF